MKKLLTIALISALIIGSPALAENTNKDKNGQKKQVLQLLKQLNKTQRALNKKFSRLSDAAKTEVIRKTSGSSDNSDDDLINDFLEGALGLNKCSSDSDDDGLDDSDEYESGDDPSDDDSDDDGYEDGLEFETRGTLESIDSSSLGLAGETYVLNLDTEYLDDNGDPVGNDHFQVGDCAEIEGHIVGADKVVEKVKADDDC